jgi:hypothetical protein
MFKWAGLGIYTAAVVWDWWCTRRILKTNPEGELNPAARRYGASLGVLAPSAVVGFLAWQFLPLFYMLTGARACYGYLQYLSFKRGLI